MQFHSKEWLDAYKEKMNSDPEYLKKASNFYARGGGIKLAQEANQR
jgi:hypothetical protein